MDHAALWDQDRDQGVAVPCPHSNRLTKNTAIATEFQIQVFGHV
uniref:Uncharacterized protein n=1 Tax=Anguilla anguilla TaxID=7936 RepID=A0A0E9TH49_ANGAN